MRLLAFGDMVTVSDDISLMSLKFYGTSRIYATSSISYLDGAWEFDSGSTMDVANVTFTGTKKIHVGTSAPSDTSGQTIWIDTN